MAQQPRPQFHYQRIKLLKTEELGVGSYGAVYKAVCDDLLCAAKIFHRSLFQFAIPGAASVMRKFEQECHLLSVIKHPHIVQYLGTYCDPESRLPVLLMELMDESLTQFLERSHEPLPYHTEVNLCHDIVMALSYLHSIGIVHQNLSSNNVLLIAGNRAKVTDFGMVKPYDVNHSTAHLTLCPGTMVYMSPEALRDRPVYNDKLDSFSFGVLGVQIMTRQFPDPGNRFKNVEINDPRAPSDRVQVEVLETERRQSHINMIDPAHPLLPVALHCLQNRDRERPSCHELCGHMSTLKASPKYTKSVRQSQVNSKPTQIANRDIKGREIHQSKQIQDLQQQLHIKDKQLHTLSDQLQEKNEENRHQQQQILGLRNLLTATNDQLQTLQQNKGEQLASKDHRLQQKELACQQEIKQLRQQPISSEQGTAELKQNLLEEKEMIQDQWRKIQELQQQPRQRGGQRREASGAAASGGSIKLRWGDGGRAPRAMLGGAVVVNGSMTYIRPAISKKVFACTSTNNKWSELPECSNYGFSLAVVNGLLTAIGGGTPNDKVTNSLLSLTDGKWTEQFPPMLTKRWLTTVVCSGRSLVVAGGSTGHRQLSTVEMMDTDALLWFKASSLPHPLSQASATLSGDQVYMLGGFGPNKKLSNSVFTCSLSALLQSCQTQSLQVQLKTLSFAKRPNVWHQLTDIPVTLSRCTSLHGQLLAVGGMDSDLKATAAIHTYNTTTNSWVVVSRMTTPRLQCLSAVLPYNELMVVGGISRNGKRTDSVEIAVIV